MTDYKDLPDIVLRALVASTAMSCQCVHPDYVCGSCLGQNALKKMGYYHG